ncbi:hypothetical protein ACFL0D_08295 [Thermoproteota archaeon]
MLAIGHFVIGYSSAILIAYILRWRNRWVYPLAYFGGLWALIPDLPQLSYTPVQIKDLVTELHNSNSANLFFLHRYLDQIYFYDLPDDVVLYLVGGLFLTIIYSLNTNPRTQS